MKLSTTINFFTYEDDGSYSAYYYDLEHYAKLGFSHLDSIFCSADAPFSPLWTNHYEDWAHKIRTGNHLCTDTCTVLQFLRSEKGREREYRRNCAPFHCLHEHSRCALDGIASRNGICGQFDRRRLEKAESGIFFQKSGICLALNCSYANLVFFPYL